VRARKLYVVGADGRGVRPLASFSCASFGEGDHAKPVPSAPEWSPNGHELAVTVTCDHDRVVEAFADLVDADGGSVFERVPIDLAFGQTRVAWSPDGSRLAYPAAAELYADAPRIATALLDGSSTTTVTSGTGDDGDPDW
jgi:Tol biopolymer transport system component